MASGFLMVASNSVGTRSMRKIHRRSWG